METTSFKNVLKLLICLEMPVNRTQYRGSAGLFNNRNFTSRPKSINFIGHTCWSTNYIYFKLYLPIFPMNLVLFLVFGIAVYSPRCSFYLTLRKTYTSILVITVALLSYYRWFTCNLLLLRDDGELNPGPSQNTAKKLSICHWNLNSIAAHNFANLVLLKAFNSIHKFDIICLPETYLDSSILHNDSNSEIPGYNLVCSDHPSSKKRGGACIYYKSYLPLRIIDINYLNECVRFELMVGDKFCNFIALYRSPIQSQDQFESFKENLELNHESAVQNNPFLAEADLGLLQRSRWNAL